MKTRSAIPLVATLAWCLSVATADADPSNKLRGVTPSDLQRYVPDQKGQWTCLDGSKSISFSAVNDDYCDCLDGSDEP
ncbi:MAG: glucosidase II beta subunit-like-domain-containing protein, partial [Podila humilis]